MLLQWREDAKVALNAPVVIVTDIILDHIYQLFLAGKAFAVVTLPFQDAPETLHWPVVNALRHARHALRYSSLFKLVMEGSVGILKSSVIMEQRMRAGIGLYRPIKGLENQWIIISVTYGIGNNATVIEVKDRAEIDLVYLDSLIPFELCYIGQPFLVRFVRMEVAVKKVFSYILRILCLPRATVIIVLDGGLNAFDPADAENALVVYMDMFVVSQVIIDAAITLIRALYVNLLDLLRDLLVLHRSGTLFPGRPTKVGSSGNVQQLAGRLNRIAFLCLALLNGSVQTSLLHL